MARKRQCCGAFRQDDAAVLVAKKEDAIGTAGNKAEGYNTEMLLTRAINQCYG
jgi:hypothetical protein